MKRTRYRDPAEVFERATLGNRSWSFSPDSSEWAIRRPHRAARSGKPPYGVPQMRTRGCLTAGWRDQKTQVSESVVDWLTRGGLEAVDNFNRSMEQHDQALGSRMAKGDHLTSRYRIARVGTLVVSTRCHERGVVRTSIQFDRRGSA